MERLFRDLSFQAKLQVTLARFRAQMALGRAPVVTYATYRTSSTAVHRALRRSLGGRTIKAHALAPAHLTSGLSAAQQRIAGSGVPLNRHVGDWVVHQLIVQPRKPAKFIILVRDPVAVAASSFAVGEDWNDPSLAPFSFGSVDHRDHAAAPSPDALAALEKVFYDGRFPWQIMARWFDEDVLPALGWDVYAQPFDRAAGILRTQHGPWEILVLRADLPDERKSEAIAQFTGLPALDLRKENSARERGHSARAAAVRQAIARRPHAVAQLLDSRFTRHFWTAEQIAAMRAQWLSDDGHSQL
ncbi:MAG: putative capsular polysaccharide synthesis family protein [Phycisphaerales bacterium]